MLTKIVSAVRDSATRLLRLGLSFADGAPIPMAMVEGSGHIVRYINPAFCQLLDLTKDEILGLRFGDLVAKRTTNVLRSRPSFRTGMPAGHTEEEHSTTHPLFWSYTMWPVFLDKRPQGIMIQVMETAELREKTLAMNEALILGSIRQHELTAAADSSNAQLLVEMGERELVEEALRKAQAQLMDRAGQLEGLVIESTAQLTATNKQLEAFVYSIAHDLRAPLRSMQAFSTMLLEEAGPAFNEAGKNYAERINKSAQYMDAMLIDLLAFSCISQQAVGLAPVPVETVIETVLSRLEADIQGANAHVESVGPWATVLAHEPSLVQVVCNLVSNALKFVRTGGSSIRATLVGTRPEYDPRLGGRSGPGHRTRSSISDLPGCSLRLDGEKYGGTGIGLAICSKGHRANGRKVWG